MDLEPIESARPGVLVVSDVNGRLWRVRRPTGALDLALAVLVLVVFAAIGAALLL